MAALGAPISLNYGNPRNALNKIQKLNLQKSIYRPALSLGIYFTFHAKFFILHNFSESFLSLWVQKNFQKWRKTGSRIWGPEGRIRPSALTASEVCRSPSRGRSSRCRGRSSFPTGFPSAWQLASGRPPTPTRSDFLSWTGGPESAQKHVKNDQNDTCRNNTSPPGSVTSGYLDPGELAERVAEGLQGPVRNVRLQLLQLLFRENLHEVVDVQQDPVQVQAVDILWQEADHPPQTLKRING